MSAAAKICSHQLSLEVTMSRRRYTKTFAILVLLVSAVPLPRPDYIIHQYPQGATTSASSCSYWSRQIEVESFLLNPKCLMYLVLTLLLCVLCAIGMMDMMLKAVYCVCTLAVHYATHHCRLPHDRPSSPHNQW